MPESAVPVITVDGPSGVGKGTISALLAAQTGFHLLDSGALYRLVGFAADKQNIAFDNADELVSLASRMDITFEPGTPEEPVLVRLDGEWVGDAIRTEECGYLASQVAGLSPVREALLGRQHAFQRAPGLVADGRDMGTVVFTGAKVKFFLDASPDARAQRRYKQLMGKGISVTLAGLFDEIVGRDQRDRNRAVSPLRPADDAIVIDTTQLGIEGVIERALTVVSERGITLRNV